MLIPVRCTSCKKVIGHLEETIQALKKQGMTMEEIFEKLDIERLCCKSILTTYVNTIDLQLDYDECNQVKAFDCSKHIEEKNKYNTTQKKRIVIAR